MFSINVRCVCVPLLLQQLIGLHAEALEETSGAISVGISALLQNVVTLVKREWDRLASFQHSAWLRWLLTLGFYALVHQVLRVGIRNFRLPSFLLQVWASKRSARR